MIDYRNIVKDRELRLKIINKLSVIPTEPYLKAVFFIKTGKRLNLSTPKTFCDKQNWLKLHNIHPEYSDYVDKVKVRKIVYEKVGKDICIPLLGIWNHYKEIDFDALPDKFVLKCNHDSGSVKLIDSKTDINHTELETFFETRLRMNPYVIGREYPYKNVKPKIIAEQYMENKDGAEIRDYKFFCFDGIPRVMFVATDRFTECHFDWFDMNFNHLDIVNIHENANKDIERPGTFSQMKNLCRKLSKGIPFVRLDFYEINGEIYFGEYTFFHGGGFWPIFPEKWDRRLSRLITCQENI